MAGFALSMFRECSKAALLVIFIASFTIAANNTLTVERIEGEVRVRHGVDETWKKLTSGDILRPEDTIKTGKNAIVIVIHVDGNVYRIPEETMIDIADFRDMNRDELLLRLAMEDMLSVPDRIDGDRPVPRTTVLHGSQRTGVGKEMEEAELSIARFRINGAQYLIDQDYRGTAVLKIRETLRLYPDGEYRIDAMMIAAESLEAMELYEEAVRYYKTVLDEDAESNIKSIAETRLEKIKNR